MKNFLIQKEKEIDTYFKALNIWKHSHFTIYLSLCYYAERLEYEGNGDFSSGFLSRLGLFYKDFVSLSQKDEYDTTWESLSVTIDDRDFNSNINFLYAYGHFCVLMPQIHRDIFDVNNSQNGNVILSFKNQEFIDAEIKDRFLSEISLPFAIGYLKLKDLQSYLRFKTILKNKNFDDLDVKWIKDIFSYYLATLKRVEILTDDVLIESLGFSNSDYIKFESSLRACSEFLIHLARSYKDRSDEADSIKEKESLIGEYLEFINCCFTYQSIDLFVEVSGLERDVFKNIFSYFSSIYSTPKHEPYISNAHIGEDYLSPFILTTNRILFSPHAIKDFLSFNNIIYSLSKKNLKLFDQKISSHLEPTLIFQVDRLFSNFSNLITKQNVDYPGGEIDYMVLSEDEKVCLVFQIKATLAPINIRSTERVESRSLEGIKQLKVFQSKTSDDKLKFVNDTFKVSLSEVKFVDVLLLRSCAGSENVWSSSELIINYQLLCGFIGGMIQRKDNKFSSFELDMRNYLKELIGISIPKISDQKLEISDLIIEFPIIDYERIFKARARLLRDSQTLGDFYSAK